MFKIIGRFFAIGYSTIILLLICCAFSLIVFAAMELWQGINPTVTVSIRNRFNAILECIGLATIGVVALELGQTILKKKCNVRRK